MTGTIALGIDMARISEIRASIDTFGQRYLDRVYTAHEQESCRQLPDVAASMLAARFAAKEAAIKVLRPDDLTPPWTSIELVRDPAGWCDIRLYGAAEALARSRGIESIAVSITHEGDLATAVVAATVRPDDIQTATR